MSDDTIFGGDGDDTIFGGSGNDLIAGGPGADLMDGGWGIDRLSYRDAVAGLSDLGPALFTPFRTYSSGMKARLAFSVSMGIDFDTYLFDEVTSVGDAGFRKQSEAILEERLETRGAIVVSHSLGLLERMCDAAVVLHQGHATWFDSVPSAIAHHRANLNVQ